MNRFQFGDKVLWKYCDGLAVIAKIYRVPDETWDKYVVIPDQALLYSGNQPLNWGYAAQESSLSSYEDPDDWYAAEVERMKERSPV